MSWRITHSDSPRLVLSDSYVYMNVSVWLFCYERNKLCFAIISLSSWLHYLLSYLWIYWPEIYSEVHIPLSTMAGPERTSCLSNTVKNWWLLLFEEFRRKSGGPTDFIYLSSVLSRTPEYFHLWLIGQWPGVDPRPSRPEILSHNEAFVFGSYFPCV